MSTCKKEKGMLLRKEGIRGDLIKPQIRIAVSVVAVAVVAHQRHLRLHLLCKKQNKTKKLNIMELTDQSNFVLVASRDHQRVY